MRILFLPGSVSSPAARFRLWQFAPALRRMRHSVEIRVTHPERYWRPPALSGCLRRLAGRLGNVVRVGSVGWLTRDIENFDVAMIQRDIVPSPRLTSLEPWLARRNPRVIFDFDDAIHLGARERKLRRILPCFACVIAGNEYLAEFARQCNGRVFVWPTVVDTDHYRPIFRRRPGPPRIGWSGSRSTTDSCLPLLRRPICDLAARRLFEFIVIADVDPGIKWPGVNVRYIPWTPETEVSGLHEIDIGVMPLQDTPFERGKCGLKAIQYGGIGVPALVSPVGVNCEIVVHGETGLHCRSDEEWVQCLQAILDDEGLRRKLGAAGRERIVARYSIRSLLPQMLKVFEKVAGARLS